jgi:hypothetical protein
MTPREELLKWGVKLMLLAAELDSVLPTPSREKSMIKTKLDEARLWAAELSAV